MDDEKPRTKKEKKQAAERARRFRERQRALERQQAPLPINLPLPKITPLEECDEEEIKINFFPLGIYEAQKKFLDLLTNRRFVLLQAGRQYGKTNVGMAAMCRKIYKAPTQMGVGWIVSPTYPMAEQLRFKMEELLAPLIVDKREGNTPIYYLEPPPGKTRPYRVEIKTAENPDRLRGPTLDWMWLDEARNMDRRVWPIILPTVAVTKGPIFVTTTPAGKNWVWEKIGEPAERGDLDYGFAKARSRDAKHFTEKDISIMAGGMSSEMARQELDADIIAFDGLVYPQFMNELHVVDPITELPPGASLIGGIDFGWKDPFVCLTVMKHNGQYVVIDEYYKSGQHIEEHVKAIKSQKFYGAVGHRWADPSNPGMMSELGQRGIGTYSANNDIKLGVDCIRRLLEQRRLFVTRNCMETIREFNQYHYPDKKDANTKDIPADSWNHAMDSLRYAIYNEESFKVEHPYSCPDDHGEMKIYGQTKDSPWMSVDEVIKIDSFQDEEWS